MIRPAPKPNRIETVADAVEALGGTVKTAALLPKGTPQQVSNAISRGFFPSWTFLILQAALNARGLVAPPSLWRIVEAQKTKTR